MDLEVDGLADDSTWVVYLAIAGMFVSLGALSTSSDAFGPVPGLLFLAAGGLLGLAALFSARNGSA